LKYLRLAEVEEGVWSEKRINEKAIHICAKPFPNGFQTLALMNVFGEDMFHGAQET
jgi:hypothetical protein